MAAPDLPLILEALEHLDREVLRLTSPAEGEAHPSLQARARRIATAVGEVRERVLDSATELTADRFEAAFRTRTILVQIELQALKAAEPEVTRRMWPATGRFQTLRQLSTFVLGAIGRVNTHWIENRSRVEAAPPSAQHQALITAIARAERELLVISRDADFVCFLALGAAALALPTVRKACRVLAALFDIALAQRDPIRATTLVHRLAQHTSAIEVVEVTNTDEVTE